MLLYDIYDINKEMKDMSTYTFFNSQNYVTYKC